MHTAQFEKYHNLREDAVRRIFLQLGADKGKTKDRQNFQAKKKARQWLNKAKSGLPTNGGDKGIRTPDLLHAKQALSQLSYTPV